MVEVQMFSRLITALVFMDMLCHISIKTTDEPFIKFILEIADHEIQSFALFVLLPFILAVAMLAVVVVTQG